jgi:hypothetical protein
MDENTVDPLEGLNLDFSADPTPEVATAPEPTYEQVIAKVSRDADLQAWVAAKYGSPTVAADRVAPQVDPIVDLQSQYQETQAAYQAAVNAGDNEKALTLFQKQTDLRHDITEAKAIRAASAAAVKSNAPVAANYNANLLLSGMRQDPFWSVIGKEFEAQLQQAVAQNPEWMSDARNAEFAASQFRDKLVAQVATQRLTGKSKPAAPGLSGALSPSDVAGAKRQNAPQFDAEILALYPDLKGLDAAKASRLQATGEWRQLDI